MIPIALTDRQMHEVKQAAQIVPLDLRSVFLERLAAELRGKDLGDGLVHRGRTLNHMGRRADSNGGGLAMTRTEVWRDCRNVKGGWRCVTEHGEELFIRYPADYAERLNTGPARVPEKCYVERDGERIEVIIERRKD